MMSKIMLIFDLFSDLLNIIRVVKCIFEDPCSPFKSSSSSLELAMWGGQQDMEWSLVLNWNWTMGNILRECINKTLLICCFQPDWRSLLY